MKKAINISETTQAIIDKRTDENGIATRAMMLCTKEHRDGIHVYTGGVDGATNFLVKRGENVAEAIEQAINGEDEHNTNEEQEDIMSNETETETTTTTTKNDKNTVEIRCITHRAWKDIQRLIDEAEQAIPEAHCRKRAEARGDTFMREIEKRAKTRRIDPRGREIYYTHKTNLGSSRWYSYIVDDFELAGCTTFTDKSLCYESKLTHGREWYPISKCVCVYR